MLQELSNGVERVLWGGDVEQVRVPVLVAFGVEAFQWLPLGRPVGAEDTYAWLV